MLQGEELDLTEVGVLGLDRLEQLALLVELEGEVLD